MSQKWRIKWVACRSTRRTGLELSDEQRKHKFSRLRAIKKDGIELEQV